MGRGKLLRLYGKRKVVTFIWEEESCYVYMGKGKLLGYMGRGILKGLIKCNNLPFQNSSFTAE
jgi:hypothetical protein